MAEWRLGKLSNLHVEAMLAASLYAAATNDDTGVVPALERGDFSALMAWLRTNVHCMESQYSSTELVEQTTGRLFDPEVFKIHLREGYLD